MDKSSTNAPLTNLRVMINIVPLGENYLDDGTFPVDLKTKFVRRGVVVVKKPTKDLY
jgi:hypothetical protein